MVKNKTQYRVLGWETGNRNEPELIYNIKTVSYGKVLKLADEWKAEGLQVSFCIENLKPDYYGKVLKRADKRKAEELQVSYWIENLKPV